MEYIETPVKKLNTRKGGKDNKMSKTVSEPKIAKSYKKTRGEHFKDIVIAVLVTAVVAFVAGNAHADRQHKATAQAVQQATAQAETPAKK